MNISDVQNNPDYTRIELSNKEQSAAYTLGSGSVLFLDDTTAESDLYHNLTPVQRVVLAARFRVWADMAEAAGDYTDTPA